MKPLKNLDAWNPTSQEILDGFINILEINLNKNWKKTMHNIAEVTAERNAWDNQCQFTSEVIMLQDLCWRNLTYGKAVRSEYFGLSSVCCKLLNLKIHPKQSPSQRFSTHNEQNLNWVTISMDFSFTVLRYLLTFEVGK